MKTGLGFIGIAAILNAAAAFAPIWAADFELSWYTTDGGGVMFSTGDDYELSGTIGQFDAGVMSGEGFTLSGGFWFEQPPGDCNTTGVANLLDYDDFESCLSGPQGGLVEPRCNCFDGDGDNDVDLSDAAWFQSAFGAPTGE